VTVEAPGAEASERRVWIEEPPDNPGMPVKPPLIFVFATAVGVGVHALWPVSARPAGWAVFGIAFCVMAAVLMQWALNEFRRHKTAVLPWKSTRVILERGPFTFTRNPIYLGFALFQMGLGFWTDRLAVVLLVIPAVAATNRFVIAYEEAYLERKFGDVYLRYKERVRRWM
jgi:protein-S-isoprenylcysteine O-methyltransferase Ste14